MVNLEANASGVSQVCMQLDPFAVPAARCTGLSPQYSCEKSGKAWSPSVEQTNLDLCLPVNLPLLCGFEGFMFCLAQLRSISAGLP
jgi:hypothetical protein